LLLLIVSIIPWLAYNSPPFPAGPAVTTKSDILDLLRRESLTVAQLCERLGVTRNAINVQLKQLEAEGLVRRTRQRGTGTVGKPATQFEAAPGSEDVSSLAYQTFFLGLLSSLGETLERDELIKVLERTGRRLAREAGLASTSSDLKSAQRAAMAVANALGASTEVSADGVMIRSFACPVGSAVRQDPCMCQALAAFFSEATGCRVTECCLREDRLICQYLFHIAKP
jgi:predicted ArsR family transcriptional regulator